MDRQYAAFISYHQDDLDSAVAKALHTLLEQYRIPRDLRKNGEKRLGIVFRDAEELQATDNLADLIATALNNSQFLIVICSKTTHKSAWVPWEIETFLKTHDRSRVLTVLASGKWNEVVPRVLTDIVQEDGSIKRVDPFSTDISAPTIPDSLKLLRRKLPELLSTMLGCHKDVLIHREQKRKTRRIASVSSAIIAVLLVFLSMLTVKNRQIAQRNEELARQTAAVQLRESQLLTEDAREALDNGDYRTAIDLAVSALPKPGEEDRPYHAPAESVLMEALGVFSSGYTPEVLNTLELTQVTEIREFCISEDGELVFTVDGYSRTRCLRTEDGALLWADTPISGGEIFLTSRINLSVFGGRLVCFRSGQLDARDPRSGGLLWRRELPDCLGGYLFYHREQDILVLMELTQSSENPAEGYLLVLSAETGDTLQRIPLAVPSGGLPSAGSFWTGSFYSAGCFSEDGIRFSGAYLDNQNNLRCFRADLAGGSANVFYSHPFPGRSNTCITALGLREDGNKLLITAHNLSDTKTASALMVDTRSGNLLWQTDITDQFFLYGAQPKTSYALIDPEKLILGLFDRVYYLDPETGAVLSQESAGGVLTSLASDGNGSFVYSLTNGFCGQGWVDAGGQLVLSTAPDYYTFAALAPHETLKVWGGGIVQHTEGSLFLLSVTNAVTPGCVTLIPEEDPKSLHIVRPVLQEPMLERSVLKMPTEGFWAGSDCTGYFVGDYLMLGPLNRANPETSENETVFLLLDPQTNEVLDMWASDAFRSHWKLFWLPDASGVLLNTLSGNLTFIGKDGTEQILADPYSSTDGDPSAAQYGHGLIRSASAYQTADTSLLTALVDQETLTLWRGVNPESVVPLPKKLCCLPDTGIGLTRSLRVSATGLIFVTLHRENEPFSSHSSAVYDTLSETWITLPDSWSIPGENNVAYSGVTQLMAVLDSSGTVHIWDPAAREIRTSFPGQVPADAAAHMEFLLGDSCLALITEDGKYLIFDISDGRVLYEDQVCNNGSSFRIYEDLANQRLYLSAGLRGIGPDGICIDLRSWTRLSYLNQLIFFDEERGILYQYNATGGNWHCFYSRIPDTAGLVAAGMSALE